MSQHDDDLFEEEEGGGGSSLASVVLPFATAIASLALGAVLGGVVGWLAKPAQRVEVQVPRELSAAELEAACAPAIAKTANELEDANQKVAVLQKDVASREAKVDELEQEMSRRAEAGRRLYAELEQAKKELADALEALAVAEEEKRQLVVELNATVAKLEQTEEALQDQKGMTKRAKEDALTNKWYRFLNDSQLEICEKGNRKKLGKCREAVVANLKNDEIRDAFAHCVRSKQATPTVHEIQKGEVLPQYAQFINEEEKITRDWYLLLCDPTLPEADGFLDEAHLPAGG